MHYDFHPSDNVDARKIFNDTQEILQPHKLIFHCYWYGEFGRKQALSIKSLLATQKDYEYDVWLWLDSEAPDNIKNDENNHWLNKLHSKITLKYYSPGLVKSSPKFRDIFSLFNDSSKLAARSDYFRLWALHEYGGCYFDLDVMFIRDMGKFFAQSEFVYSWEKLTYANSAVIFLRKGSRVNEYIAAKIARRRSSQPWVIFHYSDKNLRSLKLYSCSLFDPLWNDDSEDYIFHDVNDFFRTNQAISTGTIKTVQEIFPYSYCYHWHNRWGAEIEHDSPFEFCEKYFDDAMMPSSPHHQ